MAKLTYLKANTELEKILSEIENEQLEIETLSSKIKRAIELITFCKNKLRETGEEVEKILKEGEGER